MTWIRIVAGLLTAIMLGTVIYGFVAGSFGDEGAAILDLAWGRVTLIDLYVGVALFTGWVALRERSVFPVVLWLVAFVVLGNLATAGYALIASLRAATAEEFLLGR